MIKLTDKQSKILISTIIFCDDIPEKTKNILVNCIKTCDKCSTKFKHVNYYIDYNHFGSEYFCPKCNISKGNHSIFIITYESKKLIQIFKWLGYIE